MKKIAPLLLSLSFGFGELLRQDIEKNTPEGFDMVRIDISKGKIDNISYLPKLLVCRGDY